MTSDEAVKLENGGRYAEYLRRSLEERARASIEGRSADEALWLAHAARACRRVGRAEEALEHAARAAELARGAADPLLHALVRHARAVALRCARRYDESLAALREAAALLPAEGQEGVRAEILLETAETALEAGARADAEPALARGGALAQWLRDPRLLAWSLFLRARREDGAPADLQLAAAYELARTAGCPELEWEILWRLGERAEERARDELLWCAVAILSRLAETLDPADATSFWRGGPRRVFVDQAQRRHGPSFLHKIMLGGAAARDPAEILRGGLGFDPASVAAFLSPPGS